MVSVRYVYKIVETGEVFFDYEEALRRAHILAVNLGRVTMIIEASDVM